MIGAFFLNVADVYFLQKDQAPPLYRSPSFWVYIIGHTLLALLAAWLLYTKAKMSTADWPIVSAVATLGGFTIIQSFTLKFGGKGIDARELFDAWKTRVIEDISRTNATRKLSRQLKLSKALADRVDVEILKASVRMLAASVQADPNDIFKRIEEYGGDPKLGMAQ